MILVGERRAEERHDPVAHHLVDRALVAVDGLHHALEDGIEELARLLRIAVGEQLHRALEVGEEHGDLLALAFEGSLGGEDLLGEVLRRVGLRRASLGLRIDRRTTLQAELRRPRQLRPAFRAGQHQTAAAFQAELGMLRILVLAPRTLHAGASQSTGPGRSERWAEGIPGRPRGQAPAAED